MTNETDIGAELYALVKAEFERRIAADSTLGRLSTMKDADEYAHKVGAHLAAALAKYVKPEALPDGKLYYNIAEKVLVPSLRENHRLVNNACAKVQELLDERQGLKLRPQRGEYPEERVHELINAASHAEEWSKMESILTDSVRTLTDSFYAENVRANADFRSRAGLSVEIVREGSSKCCQWCAGLVGRYAYPNEVPKDVYRRHDNCTCSVTYVNGRDRQNVWTKARWTASAGRSVRLEKAENAEKPVRFTHEQARELEKRLTGGAYGGIIDSRQYDDILQYEGKSNFTESDYEKAVSVIPENLRNELGNYVTRIYIGKDDEPSSYFPEKREIRLNPKTGDKSIVHELGHAFGEMMGVYDDLDFLSILSEGLPLDNWNEVIYDDGDNMHDSRTAYAIESPKFIRSYQGRIYPPNEDEIITDSAIRPEWLKEYISVGFDSYFRFPVILNEKDPKLYSYLEMKINERISKRI